MVYWIILMVANVPMYFLLGKLMFGSASEFGEAIVYLIKPNMWSWFQGEGGDDFWAEMKLLFWVIMCAALVFAEHVAIGKFFPALQP